MNLLVYLVINLFFVSYYQCADDDDLTYDQISSLLYDIDSGIWDTIKDTIVSKNWLTKEQILQVKSENLECDLCTTGLDVLMTLIKQGKSYEDLKNLSLRVCYQVVKKMEYNEDILCEMILDVYGPHVVYVLNATDKSAHEICSIYHYCTDIKTHNLDNGKYDENQKPNYNFWQLDKASHNSNQVIKKSIQNNETIDNFVIVHISDTHPDDFYAAGYPSICDMPLCCRADSHGTGSARYWGDYGCNTPQKTITYMFDYIARFIKPDVIIYTGDTPMHTVYNQTLESTIHSYKWLTEQMAIYFPGIKAFPTLGNHDTFPTNLYYPKSTDAQELNKNFYELWKNISGFDENNKKTIQDGGYYSMLFAPGHRIISINANFIYLENYYCILNMEEEPFQKMKLFIENSLIEAASKKEKVILINHQLSGGNDFVDGYDIFINEMRLKYSDTILLSLVGHSHHNSFSMIRRNENVTSEGIQLVAPSMTTYKNVNPSFMVLNTNPNYSSNNLPYLEDITVYRLDITVDGNSENPLVFEAYDYLEDYDMTDLSYQEFDRLLLRMMNDDALFDAYRLNYASGLDIGKCDQTCKISTMCSLAFADYVGRQQCISNSL